MSGWPSASSIRSADRPKSRSTEPAQAVREVLTGVGLELARARSAPARLRGAGSSTSDGASTPAGALAAPPAVARAASWTPPPAAPFPSGPGAVGLGVRPAEAADLRASAASIAASGPRQAPARAPVPRTWPVPCGAAALLHRGPARSGQARAPRGRAMISVAPGERGEWDDGTSCRPAAQSRAQALAPSERSRAWSVLHGQGGDHKGAAAGAGDDGGEGLAAAFLGQRSEAVQQPAVRGLPEADRDDDVVAQHGGGLRGGQHREHLAGAGVEVVAQRRDDGDGVHDPLHQAPGVLLGEGEHGQGPLGARAGVLDHEVGDTARLGGLTYSVPR